jgi:hypothetical protein
VKGAQFCAEVPQARWGRSGSSRGIRSIALKSEFDEGKYTLGSWWIDNCFLYIGWLCELGSSSVDILIALDRKKCRTALLTICLCS